MQYSKERFRWRQRRDVAYESGLGDNPIDLLGSLADKSIVTHVIEEDLSRYQLLDIVREFASERLRDSGDLPALSKRYCTHYLDMVNTLPASSGSDEGTIVALAAEWSNIRSALRFAFEEHVDVEAGRVAVRNLWDFWHATGRTTEGWYWINRALEDANYPRICVPTSCCVRRKSPRTAAILRHWTRLPSFSSRYTSVRVTQPASATPSNY